MGNGTSENGSDRLIGVIGNGRATSSRRLTDEELERVRRYIGEGMSARQARAEVLKESPF
jgi:hypothetical protein